MSGNQFGGCGFSIVSGQNYGHRALYTYRYIYIYIHIYIYIYDIYIYICYLYTGCVVFSGLWPSPHTLVGTYQSGALLLIRVESPISQHTAALLSGGESRCPRWFCSQVELRGALGGCAGGQQLWILHTLVDTYQSWALLLVRVESPIPPHTAVLLGSVESRCPKRFFCRRGVRFSYRCFRDKKQNNRRLNQSPIRTET